MMVWMVMNDHSQEPGAAIKIFAEEADAVKYAAKLSVELNCNKFNEYWYGDDSGERITVEGMEVE